MKFIVTGIPEIDKAIKDMENKLVKKIIRKEVRKEAKKTQAEVKANIPVDEGEIKKNTKIKAIRSRKAIGVNVQVENVLHAGMLEYGTKFIQPDGTWRRAYDSNKESAKANIIKNISDAIEREISK